MTEINLAAELSVPWEDSGGGNPQGEVCITCSDEGRPLEIISVSPDMTSALARGENGEETVDVSLVGPVVAGEKILVHAGLAITKVGA